MTFDTKEKNSKVNENSFQLVFFSQGALNFSLKSLGFISEFICGLEGLRI